MRKTILAMSVLIAGVAQSNGAVRLTALQMHSVEANGKIPGVGGHRLKTFNHGGQPAIFVIEGDELDGAIINGPNTAKNSISRNLAVGTHTFTLYAENANSFSWNNYTLELHFDNSNSPQISIFAPLNSNTPLFYPPSSPNGEFTETLQGGQVKAPNTREFKSGATTVKVTDFRIADPALLRKDRVAPFEVRSNNRFDYVAQFTVEVTAPPIISAGGVVNGASFAAKVAPGSPFSIFGSDLAVASINAPSTPLPISLAGASITVGGKPAPIVFASAGQINAQIPYDVTIGQAVPVIVIVNGLSTPVANVNVVPAAPGIFQYGDKRAVLQNSDGTLNTSDNGADAGSFVVLYLTGGGAVDNPVATGEVAAASPLSRPYG